MKAINENFRMVVTIISSSEVGSDEATLTSRIQLHGLPEDEGNYLLAVEAFEKQWPKLREAAFNEVIKKLKEVSNG